MVGEKNPGVWTAPAAELVEIEAVPGDIRYGVRFCFLWESPLDLNCLRALVSEEQAEHRRRQHARLTAGLAWEFFQPVRGVRIRLLEQVVRQVLASPLWEQWRVANPKMLRLPTGPRLLIDTPQPAGPEDFTDFYWDECGGLVEAMEGYY